MAEQDSNKLIEDKVRELGDWYKRMDKTKDFLYQVEYVLKGFDGKPMNDVVNVTSNRAGIIVNNLILDLMSAKWQTVCEGVSQKQQHKIESFAQDCLDQIDEGLNNQGECGLFEWVSSHVCSRGPIGARFITTIDEDNYSIDCLPVDMRYCPFEFGKKELEWAAPISFRSGRDLLVEYPSIKRLTGDDKNLEVKDFWNKKVNEVLVGGKKIFEQENPFGHVPFVIVLPAAGFKFRDKRYLEHEAEDALFLIIKLLNEESRILSIQQTLGMETIKPATLKPVEIMDGAPAEPPPGMNQTIKVKKGEEYVLMPRGDVNKGFQLSRQDIEGLLQQGSTNFGELGSANLNRPGIWFTAQNEIRNKFLMARLKALARFREQTIRMLIAQYRSLEKITKKEKLSIGRTGKRQDYSIQQLGDPANYFISCTLRPQSKAQDVENLAQAQAAQALGMPMEIILTNILQVDDPDGVKRLIDIAKAKQLDPAIDLYEMAIRYVEEAEDIKGNTEDDIQNANVKLMESMLLTRAGVEIIRGRLIPPAPPQPPGGGNSNAIAALIANQGKGGRIGGGNDNRQRQTQELLK